MSIFKVNLLMRIVYYLIVSYKHGLYLHPRHYSVGWCLLRVSLHPTPTSRSDSLWGWNYVSSLPADFPILLTSLLTEPRGLS